VGPETLRVAEDPATQEPPRASHPLRSSHTPSRKTVHIDREDRDSHDVRIGFGSVKGLGDEEAKAVGRNASSAGSSSHSMSLRHASA